MAFTDLLSHLALTAAGAAWASVLQTDGDESAPVATGLVVTQQPALQNSTREPLELHV